MKCQDITERLDAWLDGELDGADAAVVERHLAECGACEGLLGERKALTAMLRDGLTFPAERAAAEGRFDGLWDRIAAETVLQPQPIPAPSLWQRISEWWGGLERRQVWAPALAAGVALAVMVALVAGRVGDGTDAGAPERLAVQDGAAPVDELPPFAPPQVIVRADDRRDDRQNDQRFVREGDTPAPGRRRGSEEMVARGGSNDAYVVSYEVDRGIVLIEQPEEPEQPMVVWHLLPEDVEGDEDSI